MSIGQRIKSLREKCDITQSELAKQIGTTKQTVYKYENDIVTNIPLEKIQIIADILGTTPAYLMGWEQDSHNEPQGSYRVDPAHIAPVVSTVAAGSGLSPVEDVDGYYLLPPDVKNPEEHRYFRVRGDSMEPDIKDGSMVLVHLQPQVENGELAVVIVNGDQGVVKRVQYQDGCLILLSINPAYPPRVIMGQELASTIIWGKVVYSWREH